MTKSGGVVGGEVSDENIQAGSSSGSTSALSDDVEDCTNNRNLSSGKKTNGDCWIDVTTRNVANGLEENENIVEIYGVNASNCFLSRMEMLTN
jgi:hypothetical protein